MMQIIRLSPKLLAVMLGLLLLGGCQKEAAGSSSVDSGSPEYLSSSAEGAISEISEFVQEVPVIPIIDQLNEAVTIEGNWNVDVHLDYHEANGAVKIVNGATEIIWLAHSNNDVDPPISSSGIEIHQDGEVTRRFFTNITEEGYVDSDRALHGYEGIERIVFQTEESVYFIYMEAGVDDGLAGHIAKLDLETLEFVGFADVSDRGDFGIKDVIAVDDSFYIVFVKLNSGTYLIKQISMRDLTEEAKWISTAEGEFPIELGVKDAQIIVKYQRDGVYGEKPLEQVQ